jgi:hypothetical protein
LDSGGLPRQARDERVNLRSCPWIFAAGITLEMVEAGNVPAPDLTGDDYYSMYLKFYLVFQMRQNDTDSSQTKTRRKHRLAREQKRLEWN